MSEQYREVYDPERKAIDFRKLRATNVKSNKKVHIPRPLDSETKLEIKS